MAKLLTKDYFNKHPLMELSAARFKYSLLLERDFEEKALSLLRQEGFTADSDIQLLHEIEGTDDLNALLRYARREIPMDCEMLVRKKLLEREEEVLPLIRRRLSTTTVDIFIENILHLLVDCKDDPVPWLLEDYPAIRSPYARSMMCLVFGFRADPSVVPFLMRQVDFFELAFPDESFSQGPLLALYELRARFETI